MNRTLTATIALLATVTAHGGSFVFYSHDFESPVSGEWLDPVISTTPVGGRSFLGPYSNFGTILTLNSLPAHASATVSFNLFVIRSWDGNGEYCCGPDQFLVDEGGDHQLLYASFTTSGHDGSVSTQSYPDSYGQPQHPANTGASEVGTLGYTWDSAADAVYQTSLSFIHSDATLAVTWAGFGLEGVDNEAWGLDNVTVTLHDTIIVPEPSEWMFVAGLAAAAFVGVRRMRRTG